MQPALHNRTEKYFLSQDDVKINKTRVYLKYNIDKVNIITMNKKLKI